MQELQCDLITIISKKGLPSACSHNFKYILTVKDCFSKYCWLKPLESKEGLPIANCLNHIFHEHGAPRRLHSDNGSEFINRFVKEVCSKYNVRIVHGRPYHPQSQGQVENLNRHVKNCLRHFLLEHEEDDRAEVWPQLIGEVEYFVNHTWHHTIRNTPYFVFFGRIELHNVGKIAMQPEFMEDSMSMMKRINLNLIHNRISQRVN